MKFNFPEKRIILVGGPGGVGKTTLAASLAIRYAQSGARTIVLTVDPARRLAQALGLVDFHHDLEQVHLPHAPKAVLYASMLDTQRYFDRIIEKFAKSPEQKTKILNNSLYRTMVSNLGGTHEYAAMERLLEFANDPRFDKIVVDTPPTQNAIDLLGAPQRLADFMDNSVLRWFRGSSPRYLQLFRTGTKLAMKMLQKVFGIEFLNAFAQFIDDMDGMEDGFKKRNLQVIELLQSATTAFLLATYPSQERFEESILFAEKLATQKIQLHGLILNRLELAPPAPVQEVAGWDSKEVRALTELLRYQRGLYEEQHLWVDRFIEAFSSLPRALIPYQTALLHDLSSLSQLGESLVELNYHETKDTR